jgi:hypothetical protein
MNVTHRTDPTKLGRLRILVRPRRAADRNPLPKARPWEGMRVVDGGQPCQPTSPFDFHGSGSSQRESSPPIPSVGCIDPNRGV